MSSPSARSGTSARLLEFTAPLEQRFKARRQKQLVRNDLSWCLVMALLWVVSVSKYDADELRRMPLVDAGMMALWVGWLPVVASLALFKPDLYIRHRTPLMLALRLCRHVSVLNSSLPRREAKWVGSVARVPHRPLYIYFHLCWKVNALLFGAVAFITPIRHFIPLQFLMLLMNLHATARRCAAECGTAAPLAAHAAAAWPATCGADALGAEAACPAGGADPEEAAAYYGSALAWIHALVPLWGRRPGSGCLGVCWAVHGWLQAVGGMLLPLALLWAQEERLRAAELALAAQQQSQRRDGAEAQADPAARGSQAAPARHASGGSPARPLAVATLCGWLWASAVLLWLLLELAFL